MSSKQQFKEALKEDKKIIANLRKDLQLRDTHITLLQKDCSKLKQENNALKPPHPFRYMKKKWYQFWKSQKLV